MPALGSQEALDARRRRAALRGVAFVVDPTRDLAAYLSGPFVSGLPLRISSWRPDATGQQVSDAMVSRLEVVAAIARLPNHLWYVMDGLYQRGWTAEECARRLRIDRSTVYRRRVEAIMAMVPYVYEGEWTALVDSA